MTRYYCTLLDRDFLSRGIALYESLCLHSPDFVIWVLCMDEDSFALLDKLNLSHVRLLRLSQVEDQELLRIKPTRSKNEYCWTFSSALPLYLLTNYPEIPMITYLDADLYFYDSIDIIFESMHNYSILLIPHRFSIKNSYREKMSGIYNVGMMIFKNNLQSLKCLKWWKDRCVEWCFAKYENGKLGDQLYLNDWPTRFDGVYVLHHHGADVAPWNIDRYQFNKINDIFEGILLETGQRFNLIFYHFHALKIYKKKNGRIGALPLTVYEPRIYQSYLIALQEAYKKIHTIDPKWLHGLEKPLAPFYFLKHYIQRYARQFKKYL